MLAVTHPSPSSLCTFVYSIPSPGNAFCLVLAYQNTAFQAGQTPRQKTGSVLRIWVHPSRCTLSPSPCCRGQQPDPHGHTSRCCPLASGWVWSIGGASRRSEVEGGKSQVFVPSPHLDSPWVTCVSAQATAPVRRLSPRHTVPSCPFLERQ